MICASAVPCSMPLANVLGDLVFLEPWGLLGLMAPAVLLLLGLIRHSSRVSFLGTARFFRSETDGGEGRSRRTVPAWLMAAVAALVVGALALASPGVPPTPPAGVAVELVIDRSPSMFHPIRRDDPAGKRRIDVAFEAFRAWAGRHEAETGVPVLVRKTAHELVPWSEVKAPDAPAGRSAEPLWPALDAPGSIWITDRAVAGEERKHAGLFASGGESIPGPIAMGPAGSVEWLSDGTTEFRPGKSDGGAVYIEAGVPARLHDLMLLWAAERGLVVTKNRARADLALLQASDRGARALTTSVPGEIRLGLEDLTPSHKDPAAFAVSWIAVFDRARPAPRSVLEAEERAAAGSPVSAPPRELPVLPSVEEERPRGGSRVHSDRVAALLRTALAAASAALGIAAVVLLGAATDRRLERRR